MFLTYIYECFTAVGFACTTMAENGLSCRSVEELCTQHN